MANIGHCTLCSWPRAGFSCLILAFRSISGHRTHLESPINRISVPSIPLKPLPILGKITGNVAGDFAKSFDHSEFSFPGKCQRLKMCVMDQKYREGLEARTNIGEGMAKVFRTPNATAVLLKDVPRLKLKNADNPQDLSLMDSK
jgi:hypothetical protein